MDFKRQKIDSKSSVSLSAPLPYYDEAEITKKLAEHTKYLHEWEELINRNAEPSVTAISQKDASRHIYLKKKLHDSLGIMARIVQHQMAMKKASNQIASETKYGATVGTSEPQQRDVEGDKKHREPVNYPLGGDSSVGTVDNHNSSSHAAPPSSYLYAGHPSHFNSATTYQPYSNSNNAYSTTTHQPAPPINAMYSYPQQISSHTSAIAMAPGVLNNEYIRQPTFVSQPTSSSQLNHGRFPNQGVASHNLNEGVTANQQGVSYSHLSHGAPLLHPSDPHQEPHN